MRVGLWIPALLAVLPAVSWAQEKPADPEPRPGGFFREKMRVSFWKDEPKTETPGSAPGQVESLWAEPIRLPDGRMTTYVPPKQVLAFLENPTEESGLAYLAWQKERMAKIARASEILARLSDRLRAETAAATESRPEPPLHGGPPEQGPIGEPEERVKGTGAGAVARSVPEELLYFKREGCPHCRHEDAEIEALKTERPALKVKILSWGKKRISGRPTASKWSRRSS